jgi:hypothetical protein
VTCRRIPVWDVCLVLRVLTSAHTQELDENEFLYTACVVFLVALASGDRCSALAALKFPPISSSDSVIVEFEDKFVPKSYFLRKNLTRIKPLSLPRVAAESLLQVCPARAVERYCERVAHRRHPSQSSLFIPHNSSKTSNIRIQSIARYLTAIVAWCYEKEGSSCPIVRAHDVRKVAAAMRELTSTSLTDVLQAGEWATPSVYLDHYKFLFSRTQETQLHEFEGVAAAKTILSLQTRSAKK